MNEDKLKIYVCAHKPFDESVVPPNECYEIMFFNDIHNDLEKFKDFYSEGYHIYEIAHKNIKNDYIGICHYRRFFDDTCDNIIKYMEEYDCILPQRFNIGNMSVYGQYSQHFNGEDLEIIGHIIEEHYPDYTESYYNVMNNSLLRVWNMCIMKKDDFKEYVNWVFDVLTKFIDIKGFKSMEDVNAYVEQNKNKIPNMTNTVLDKYFTSNWYCSRIGAHLLERLLNVFVDYKFNNVKEVPVKFIS